ncbi:hypothetical protein [Actinoplanes sp. URMC 104]|uniref:hypothetical protein n=1 Tax=Actinoplanes sp. URMC 104 TaxID=3423409 RepID=UPI003F1CAA6C
MTFYVEYELRCDGAAGPYDCEPAIYANTKARALDDARHFGWLIKGSKHYCTRPEHREKAAVSVEPSGA